MTCQCPHCKTTLDHPELTPGRRVQCWHCQQKFEVPSEPVPPPTEPATVDAPEAEPPVGDALPAAPPAARAGKRKMRINTTRQEPSQAASPPPKRGGKGKALVAIAALLIAGGIGWRMTSARSAEDPTATATAGVDAPAAPAKPQGPLADDLEALVQARDLRTIENRLLAALAPVESAALDDADTALGLAQWQFVSACQPAILAELDANLLQALLTDRDWLDAFLLSDPPAKNDWGIAAKRLDLLHRRHGADFAKPLYRRLATAVALSAGDQKPYWVDRCYVQWRDAHKDGLMHVSFETADVRSIRWCLSFGLTDEEHQFVLNQKQGHLNDYFGACWAIPYLLHNAVGDSIHGPHYYPPWAHAYSNWEMKYRVGGVCGTLSHFGSLTTRVHGIPSTAVGQPGHCAYVIRRGNHWPVAYSVTWPTGFTAPGWQGTGYATANHLYETVRQNHADFARAAYVAWLAKLKQSADATRVAFVGDVRWKRYRGNGSRLPDFNTLTPEAEGAATSVNHGDAIGGSRDNYSVVWEGELSVENGRNVSLYLHSDDESRLLIDDKEVARTNCKLLESLLTIAPGKHTFRLEYAEGGGHDYLTFRLEGAPRGGAWIELCAAALQKQPENFGLWRSYVDELERLPNYPTAKWEALARQAADDLGNYPEAAWAIAHACSKHLTDLSSSDRLQLLLDLNRRLTQEKAKHFEAFPYQGTLNWQLSFLNDPDRENLFFLQLLRLHPASPPHDWTWGQILSWMRERLTRDSAGTARFTSILTQLYAHDDADGNVGQLTNVIRDGILAAEKSGNHADFLRWNDLAKHLLAKETAASPAPATNNGDLLSKEALLQISSTSRWDNPLRHQAVIAAAPGDASFHTDKESNPHATVILPGACSISRICIVNTKSNPNRQLPLAVSVSADGKTWIPLASFDKNQKEWIVDPNGRADHVTHLRIERPENRAEYFHLNSILVYGKKHY